MIGWNFPSNNFGKEDGLNDPGIETFRGTPLRSLAREINQNSCDAHDGDSKRPVEVHFDLLDLSAQKFPDAGAFAGILESCGKYWGSNANAKKFFRNAHSVMRRKKIPLLKISDYNTTGLLGSDTAHGSDWFKLTKSVGASDKEGGAGGSFGIGKHAPFACSDVRTVFYGTKDKAGKFAFQGVSKLVTHENGKGETTQGTGYYGVVKKNLPIVSAADVDPIFRRENVGTDVFVAGFHPYDDWADEVAKSVLENFFVAIHEGRLIVRVGDVLLNKASLPKLIRQYASADPDYTAHAYFDALTADEAAFFSEDDFEGLGRIELHLLPNKDYPKRVAMVRSTGMKIYDKGHFQTPMRFAGVFIAKGSELNALLRSLEPPSHDAWEHGRHENPAEARAILKKLYGWINDKVRSISSADDSQELDVEGLSQYLPDDTEDAPLAADSPAEGEKSEPMPEVSMQIRVVDQYKPKEAGPNSPSAAGDETGSFDDDGGTENGGDGGEPPAGDGGGGEFGGNGAKAPEGAGSLGSVSRPVGLHNVRIYCSDPASGKYRIMFEPDTDGEGHLTVNVVGEVGEDPAPLKEIYIEGEPSPLAPAAPGRAGPIKFSKGKRAAVDVVLDGSLHCALGVSAHAN